MAGALAREFPESHRVQDDFLEALETNRPSLYRVARRTLGCRETAEDLVQETLYCALRSRRRYDSRRPLGSWLYGILQNQLKNHYARRTRDQDLVEKARELRSRREPAKGSDPECIVLCTSAAREVRRALKAMPPKLAAPLELYYFRGHDVRGVADALEITEENAKIRLHRGRKALKAILTE